MFISLKQTGYYRSLPALASKDTAFCPHTLYVWFLKQNGGYLPKQNQLLGFVIDKHADFCESGTKFLNAM